MDGDGPERQTGKELARRWGLVVKQSLYRKTGDWDHQLRKFPGALLDADGYVIFENEGALKACPALGMGKDPSRHGGWMSAPQGIKAIPGYVYMSAPDGETDRSVVESPVRAQTC